MIAQLIGDDLSRTLIVVSLLLVSAVTTWVLREKRLTVIAGATAAALLLLAPAPALPGSEAAFRLGPLLLAASASALLLWPLRKIRQHLAARIGASALLLLAAAPPLNGWHEVIFTARLGRDALVTMAGVLAANALMPGLAKLSKNRLLLLSLAGGIATLLLYLTPVFGASLRDTTLQAMSLAVLFYAGVIARRQLFPAASLWCGLGIYLSLSPRLLAASWYGATGRTFRPDALLDQQQGGAMLFVLALALVVVGNAQLSNRRRAVES
ncbi:hypothetical protein KRX56_02130 [Dermabacteraceae bacterium TAE3-ERU27]|nr:hypothetical protein [Dermabacteraceae bacterium TAE3-ERU27]